MRYRKSEKGFTIIELVVVILLLGILTATALPRFMDVTDQAHTAVVDGVTGGLATGVALARAQWFGTNRPATLSNFGDGTVQMSTNGYPTGVTGGIGGSSANCVTVFSDVLQGGRPTTLTATQAAASQPTTAEVVAAGYTQDFAVFGSVTSTATCFYVYTAQGAAYSAPVIEYDSTIGEVYKWANSL